MADSSSIADIEVKAFDVFFDGIDMGFTEVDSLQVEMGAEYLDVTNSDQLFGMIASWEKGFNFVVNMTLMQANIDFLFEKVLRGRYTKVADASGNRVYKIVNSSKKLHDTTARLELHPRENDRTDRSGDYTFTLTEIKLDGTQLLGSRDSIQSLQISFVVFPNFDNNPKGEVAMFGDPSTVETDPDTAWISTSEKLIDNVGIHLDAIEMDEQMIEQLYCWGYLGADSSTTAAIDEAGNITISQNSFNIDATATGDLRAGDIIKIDTEYMLVGTVTALTATTATLSGVRRGMYGSAAATHLDNAVVTLRENNSFINRSIDGAAWASSTPATATVGNIPTASLGVTKSGVVEALAAGTTNITGTVGATASPNCALTVNLPA